MRTRWVDQDRPIYHQIGLLTCELRGVSFRDRSSQGIGNDDSMFRFNRPLPI